VGVLKQLRSPFWLPRVTNVTKGASSDDVELN